MRILADTSVFVQFLRTGDDAARMIFQSEEIYVCGVIKAELIRGARSEKEARYLEKLLDSFPGVEMENPDWSLAGRGMYQLRMGGLTLPFQDALIAYLAIKNDLCVWTLDKHFEKIREILPQLKLYEHHRMSSMFT